MAKQMGLESAWTAIAEPWIAGHPDLKSRGTAQRHWSASAFAAFEESAEAKSAVHAASRQIEGLQDNAAGVRTELAALVKALGRDAGGRPLDSRANATIKGPNGPGRQQQQPETPQWVRQEPLWAAPAAAGSSTEAAPSADPTTPAADPAAETQPGTAAPPPEPKLLDKITGELAAETPWQSRGYEKGR